MTCTEFRKVLPYIIDSDPTAEEHAHLDSCRVCNDVVADLKLIAQSLLTLEEPPARVWHKLRRRLELKDIGCASHKTPTFLSTSAISSVEW